MLKGLFNYEKAYRRYAQLFLEDLVRDNIDYAEIRPNFMKSNQLFTDDGMGRIDNRGMIDIIVEEVTKFKKTMAANGHQFGGIKIIYTTPRSVPLEDIEASLQECLKLKQEFPQWIAGTEAPSCCESHEYQSADQRQVTTWLVKKAKVDP